MSVAAPAALESSPRAERDAQLLYERYGRIVFGRCMQHLRRREDAEDAVQTTFVYALMSLRRGVVPRFELAWLLTIASNVCSTRRRNDMRRLNVETPRDLEDLDEIARPRADVERRLDVTRLRSALETLPDSQRRAILLREWRGFSYSEIASELGVTESATETLLFRARKTLARKLEETHAAFVGNVATAGSFLRSLLTGGVAKTAAVGVVAASVAAVPLVRHDVARTTRANSPSPVTVAPSHVVRRTIDHPAVRPAATARATHPRFATHAPQTQAPASTAAVSVTLGASTPDTPKSPSAVSPPAAESNHATTAATRPTVSAPPELPVPVALPATPKIDAGVIAVALPPVTVPVAPVALPTP